MQEYEAARENLVTFFLTELSDETPPSYVETLAREFLLRTYSSEWVDEFWESCGEMVVKDLVEEYNRRIEDGFPVPFSYIDAEATKIRPCSNSVGPFNINAFQRALLELTDAEFERLSARILSFAGCTTAWATPTSHDQGLDAFGCFPLFAVARMVEKTEDFKVWVLVQAKHYKKEKVSSSHIREFLGSSVLAKYGIYATEGVKYRQLEMKAASPIALVLVTSGEIKRTARLIASKAGIYLVTSSDLCAIFSAQWKATGMQPPATVQALTDTLRTEIGSVQVTG